jgi:hypothetical protein
MDSNELKAKAAVGAANQRMGGPQITPDMLRNSQSIKCDCGGMIFAEKLFFKKISALISHSAKEELAPMPIIVCENCKRVPRLFDSNNILPEEIKAVKSEKDETSA